MNFGQLLNNFMSKDQQSMMDNEDELSMPSSTPPINDSSQIALDGLLLALSNNIQPRLCSMYRIWERLGMAQSQRESRESLIVSYVVNLMEEMLAEEQILVEQVVRNVSDCRVSVQELCQQLGEPEEVLPENLSLIDQENAWKRRLGQLEAEKTRRFTEWRELLKREVKACDLLGIAMEKHKQSAKVPCLGEIDLLEMKVADLDKELEMRKKSLTEWKKSVRRLISELEYEPSTEQERMMVKEVLKPELVFTSENIKVHKTVLRKLEELEKSNKSKIAALRAELLQHHDGEAWKVPTEAGASLKLIKLLESQVAVKRDQVRSDLEEKQKELAKLWRLCQVPDEHKEKHKNILNPDVTQVDHSLLRQEINRLRRYYSDNRTLLDSIETYTNLFDEHEASEKRCVQSSRFFKSSGALKEEKMKSDLHKQLVAVEKELLTKVSEWEKETGLSFLVRGLKVNVFIDGKWEKLRSDKLKWKSEPKKKLDASPCPLSATSLKRKKVLTPKIAAKIMKLEGGTPNIVKHSCCSKESQNANAVTPTFRDHFKLPFVSRSSNKQEREGSAADPIHVSGGSIRNSGSRFPLRHNKNVIKRTSSKNLLAKENLPTSARKDSHSGMPPRCPSKVKVQQGSSSSMKPPTGRPTHLTLTSVLIDQENHIDQSATYEDFTRGLRRSEKSFLSSSIAINPPLSVSTTTTHMEDL